MIIFEGTDKAGKSTLIEAVRRRISMSIDVKKFSVPDGNPIPDYIEEIRKITAPKIYDRFVYGEVPYSIVKKRPRYMKWFELRMLDLMIMSLPHLVVYVRPTLEEVQERFKQLPDDYVSVAEACRVYDEYEKMMADHVHANKAWIKSPWDKDDFKKLMVSISKVCSIEAWRKHMQYRHTTSFIPGIGTIEPRFLFIGERYNFKADNQITFWSKSGEFLMETLDEAKVKPNLCHFTNAIGPKINPIIPEQIFFLYPKKIICLGKVAYENVSKFSDFKDLAVEVPHPSYWSRFKSSHRDEYVKILEDACKL